MCIVFVVKMIKMQTPKFMFSSTHFFCGISIVVRDAVLFSGHLATVSAENTKHNGRRAGALICSHDPLTSY